MYIHLLSLGLIDGAGSQVTPPAPSPSPGGGADSNVDGWWGHRGANANHNDKRELDEIIKREARKEPDPEPITPAPKPRIVPAPKPEPVTAKKTSDLVALNYFAALESAAIRAAEMQALLIEEQLQAELLEEEELIALALML